MAEHEDTPKYDREALDFVKFVLHEQTSPIMAYRRDGELVYVNKAYDELFADRYPDGCLGHNVVSLEPEKSELLQEMVDINLAQKPGDPIIVVESPTVDAVGDNRWFEWRCMHSFDDDGNVQIVVAVSRDITQQRLAEFRSTRVAERLQESNRDLLEFAQVASHDLQEPLRKVTAFSSRLQDNVGDNLDEKSEDYMRRMNGAVSRMQSLIDDLLTFARVTTRGTAMLSTPIRRIIDDVVSDLEIAIEEAGAVINIGRMPTLPVDESQIGQLFQNLIGNAIKFRRDGVSPEITIHAMHVKATSFGGDEPRKGWYDITVTDNGIGFDEKYAAKIFAPFQRLHGRSEYDGTGVGLSVCRRIAERHQGSISATSEVGAGTTFTVRLPTSHLDTIPVGAEPSDALDEAALDVEHTTISHAA